MLLGPGSIGVRAVLWAGERGQMLGSMPTTPHAQGRSKEPMLDRAPAAFQKHDAVCGISAAIL